MNELLPEQPDDVDRIRVGERIVADHAVHERRHRFGRVEVLVENVLLVAHLEDILACA